MFFMFDNDFFTYCINFQQGYIYGRLGNPNLESVECAINELEGGAGSMVFSSGMAAITTAISAVLKSGDHMVGVFL